MQYLITTLLIAFSAVFSGLTLGMLSLSTHDLKRKKALGDELAAKIYPVRAKGNQLLVTLILGNVLVNAILSVYLGTVASGLVAVIVSTILITIFGEIVPQATFSRHSIKVGAFFAPAVEKAMLLTSPITYPIAWVLDKLIGAELPTRYSKRELVKIVEEHSVSDDSDVEADEVEIVRNALHFGDKPIEEIMTPRKVISAVKESDVISPGLLKELYDTGFSRFPVYKGNIDNIVGTLFSRDLIGLKGKKRVSDAMDKRVFYVNESDKLDHVLNAFIKTNHHQFIVVNEFKETVGVISIEDIIEEILGREIVDEFDNYEDLRAVALKNKPTSRK